MVIRGQAGCVPTELRASHGTGAAVTGGSRAIEKIPGVLGKRTGRKETRGTGRLTDC